MQLRLHPGAVVDLTSAGDWYERPRPGLGSNLLLEVDRALATIAADPLVWPIWPGLAENPGIRRFLLVRFPFSIAYLVRGSEIVVLAVAHLRRRPGYWSAGVAGEP